jgi:2,3-bisphosphoglycerate-independent phosphoglycerate mutase
MSKKAILIITDGIGHNSSDFYNAFSNASTPTYDRLFSSYPHSMVATSGLAVGLPDGQMGNSEVGHMSLGSGRVIYQDLVKINKSIQDDTLKSNIELNSLIDKSNNIHLIGLVSDGGVHSHIEHIKALAKICADKSDKTIYLHIITDGRDVSPKSAKTYIQELINITNNTIKIATISGRYYTMDRDKRYDRVQKGFLSISKAIPKSDKSILDYVEDSYNQEILDEFIVPCAFDDYSGIKQDDGVIFCNFRSDRFREITQVMADSSFDEFDTKDISSLNLNIATMTIYNENLPLPILFPKVAPTNTLAQIISQNNLTQSHIAETEKYAHVTFFFNGGVEQEYKGEKRVLVPSPDVATYDMKPEMSASEVCDETIKEIEENRDFIVVNFANGDMVGHTGVYEAGIKAVECVDEQLGKIVQKAQENGYSVLITSDHGNCEMMKDSNGNTLTNHTTTEVYAILVSNEYKEIKDGRLSNIAPTVLKLMDIDIPPQMDEALI